MKRAELLVIEGEVVDIRYLDVAGRLQLTGKEMRSFQEVVQARADEIVARWIDFFVLHKSITPENITRRLI